MTLYIPTLMEAVTGDTAITYHAQDFRNIVAALTPVEGIVRASDLAVSQRGAGANMSVDVAPGKALIQGDSVANQGSYICYSDATYNVPITAANASNPRIDIIVATVHDKQADGGSSYGWTLTAIAGTPAATPTVPTTPGSTIKLAEVRVNANAASITTSNITDRRLLSGVGDVPKWDLYGTAATPQSIPSQQPTQYTPRATLQQVGVSIASGSIVAIQTPGRYVVHLGMRLGNSAAGSNRITTIQVSNSSGAITRRIANMGYMSAGLPVTASGTIYLSVGDTITPFVYQDSGSALSVDDSQLEANFTGVWVGA